MASFSQATEPLTDHMTGQKGETGQFQLDLDPDWTIWGPFGGYLAAIAVRAMGQHSKHARPATFSCQYLNQGVPGPVELAVEPLKEGRAADCLKAQLKQDGKPLMEAQSWITKTPLKGLDHEVLVPPDVPDPGDTPLFQGNPQSPEEAAPLWQHIARRSCHSFHKTNHAPSPAWTCWLRLDEDLNSQDLVMMAARAVLWMDLAPWNASLMVHTWPLDFIAPTLDLTVQFQPDLYSEATRASSWSLVATQSPVARDGLVGSHTSLWSEDYKLLALGTAQSLCRRNPFLEELRSHPPQTA